ncbi:MAG: hypothetical protein SF053_17435 [Bacteroidia bacterium]|nr:hypothetical protein [Bacteroidia bacterium]
MNPGEKGWLKKYIAFFDRRLRESSPATPVSQMLALSGPDQFVYQAATYTGLWYGHPVDFVCGAPADTPHWTEKDKMKVILAEMYLLSGMYLLRLPEGQTRPPVRAVVSHLSGFLARYAVRNGESSRRSGAADQIEAILDRSIHIRRTGTNVWGRYFHNSFLLLEIWLYLQYGHAPDTPSEVLQAARERLQLGALRVIAAAAHADGVILPQERALFEYFRISAGLPPEADRRARALLVRPEPHFVSDETGAGELVSRYYLTLGLLTTLAAGPAAAGEERFLNTLAHQLRLRSEALRESRSAAGVFVWRYWHQVHYFQRRHQGVFVSAKLLTYLRVQVRRHKTLFRKALDGSRELGRLLHESTRRALTPTEKQFVRIQILDLLKSVPAFTLFMLPGAFITLPILFRIIPKTLIYPSAFLPEHEEEFEG